MSVNDFVFGFKLQTKCSRVILVYLYFIGYKFDVTAFPSTLSTHIFPPCLSTNSLQRIKPRPVPISPDVPL
jgi:hypothetical protein